MGLIYLDSCLVIYLTESHPRWGDRVGSAMARSGDARFGISPLVKCECLVGPIKRGDPVLQRAYTDLFELLVTVPMPEAVYLQAAQLRRGRDSIALCAFPLYAAHLALHPRRLAGSIFGAVRGKRPHLTGLVGAQ